MNLDALDIAFLDHKGSSQDTLNELLNWQYSKNNAEKARKYIRKYLKQKLEINGEGRQIGEMEETVVKADGTTTTKRMFLLSEEESKNPNRIMMLMGYDPIQWELISCKTRRNYWDVSMKLHKGYDHKGYRLPEQPYKTTNHAFECIITVKPIQNILSTQSILDIFSSLEPPNIQKIEYKNQSSVMVEPSILDFHLGKSLSLEDEEKLYRNTILEMIQKIGCYRINPEKILIQIGQDFIHVDSSNKTTTSGTIINSPHEWSDIYKSAVELLVWSIDQFRQLAPVDCFYIPGNHDKVLSFCLAMNLKSYFKNCPDVTVDVIDYPRKYYQYGLNAIGMSHGREEGRRIEEQMQQEAPQIFADTIYREFHLGDLHSESSYEKGGIIYRRTSAITALDGWHIKKGYRATRKAPMYVWHKSGGVDIINVMALLE